MFRNYLSYMRTQRKLLEPSHSCSSMPYIRESTLCKETNPQHGSSSSGGGGSSGSSIVVVVVVVV
jgi:hypothetical protein